MALNLITDREIGDVNRWRQLCSLPFDQLTIAEQTEWLAGLKGAYNYTDLNRVEDAVATLSAAARRLMADIQAYLDAHGVADDVWFSPYEAEDVKPVYPEWGEASWIVTDIPTSAQMEGYLSNITMLRGLLEMLDSTPPVPEDMDGLQYWEANDIEQILLDVDAVREAWQALREEQIRYVGNYNYQLICGTLYAGSHRTLQHLSRGR